MHQNDLKVDKFSYEEANVALYDPNMRMRTLMRGMLLTIGFRSINECRSAEEIVNAMMVHPVDLLIIDLDYEAEEICGIVRDIREGTMGTNPYIVIIGLTWKPELEMIARSLQTGLDDLIAKPISPNILSQRTTKLVFHRKEFVVTTSYVGPDRRGKERQIEGDLAPFRVPNSLRYKAIGDMDSIADTQALDTTQHVVNIHRIFRFAKEISNESEELENRFAARHNGQKVSWNYREMSQKISTINRMIAAEEIEILAPIAESMQEIVKAMFASNHQTARHFSILRLHGEAISEAIKDERAAVKLIAEALEEAVKIVRSTLAEPAGRSAA